MRSLRKIAALLGVLFVTFTPLLFSSPAHADTQAGLTQDVYTYSSEFLPDRVDTYTLCNTSTVSNINFDVGGDVVANCQEDFVVIHWHGYITLPVDGEITFQSYADDGFYMTIGDSVVIDNWWLKGCWGTQGTATFQSGVSQKIDIWWYEYGGGACNYLYYNDPTTGFNLVPDSAYSVDAVPVIPVDPPVDPEPQPTDPPVDPTPVDPPVDPVDPPTPVDPPIDPPTPVDPPVDPPVPPVVPPVPVDPPVVPPVVVPDPPVVKPPVVVPPVVKPPVVEPPVVVPSPQDELKELTDIKPTELTPEEVTQIQEVAYSVLETAPEGSPEYQQALDALYVASQADDIEVSEELAAVPVLGSVAVGVTNAINFVGNVGSDMAPATREKAKKAVVVGVVAVGAAVQAAAGAAGAAAAASSSPSSRRK